MYLQLVQRIRGFTTMRYINPRFTYLLTYCTTDDVDQMKKCRMFSITTGVLAG